MIEVQHLTYQYPGADGPAVDDLSLTIGNGQFVAILGHNGSGKSTLAKHFNGILRPTSGKVLVNGLDTSDPANALDIRRAVGMVFQNPDNQLVANIVEDDVAFAPENLGVPSGEIRRRVDEALRLVGMYDYRMHAPHLLSGGQKQRVAIAGVIAMQPGCIVLDEPTAMLDPLGLTVVHITHHMDECIGADRLIVMSEGHIVADGAPAEVFSRVEQLKAEGLAVPATTELLYQLRQAGMDVPLDALSVENCAKTIADALRG